MIHDNLIDTIIERAEDYYNSLDYINACKCYERALRRIFNTIEEEKFKTLEEYYNKYDCEFLVENCATEYLSLLDDCFCETGDKSYLEKVIEFKEKHFDLFKTIEYMYMYISRCEIEAIFYLGRKDEAFEKYQKFIDAYPTESDSYFNLSRLYYEAEKIEEAIKVLKIGIEKCKGDNSDLRYRLDEYEEEMKEIQRKSKK